MARYRTILLDADETLFDFQRSERHALGDTLRAAGIEPTVEMQKGYSEINARAWKRLERGEITKEALRTERFAELCRHFSLNADEQKLSRDYIASLATQSFLLDGALELCKDLFAHCRLYIITNGIAAVQHGRFDRSPIKPYFKEIFISDEIGVEKPHKAFFEGVANRIPDFDPASTLVVGDSLTSDMAGGIGAGLDTCWYNPSGKEKPADMPITYTIKSLGELLSLVLGA